MPDLSEINDPGAIRLIEGLGLTPVPQASLLAPAGVYYETIPRNMEAITATGVTLTTQILSLHAIALPAGLNIGKFGWVSGSTAATLPLNQWSGLFDSTRKMLAVSADQTSGAWAANTLKTFAVATTAAGAKTNYITPYTGLYYLGLMVRATTAVPNLAGMAVLTALGAQLPLLSGNSSTAQTTPPAFPFTAAAITQGAGLAYAWVGP